MDPKLIAQTTWKNSADGLRDLWDVVRRRRENLFRPVLARMCWGFLPHPTLASVTIVLLIAYAMLAGLLYDLSRSPSLVANFINWPLTTPQYYLLVVLSSSWLSPFLLLALVFCWRWRKTFASSFYRNQLLLIPGFREKALQACLLQVLWVALVIQLGVFAYLIFTWNGMRRIYPEEGFTFMQFVMGFYWEEEHFTPVNYLAFIMALCKKITHLTAGFLGRVLPLAILVMTLLRFRSWFKGVIVAGFLAGAYALVSLIGKRAFYGAFEKLHDLLLLRMDFVPGLPVFERLLQQLLSILADALHILLFVFLLGLLWHYCRQWFVRQLLPVETDDGD